MGSALPRARIEALSCRSRRPLAAGELGILESNVKAWADALSRGWSWSLVLEDDAVCLLEGGFLQLLSLLPALVEAAAAQDGGWQLIALSPVDCAEFFGVCEPAHIPSLLGDKAPAWARKPQLTTHEVGAGAWQRVGPTFHAFGWVYRAPLMRALLDSYGSGRPLLNPLDVWVWEVMAERGMLSHALSPVETLVTDRGGASVKAQESES